MSVPSSRQVIVISQSSTTAAATASGTFDTQGYDFCSIDVLMATSNATSNNPSTFNLLEDDTTVASNFATVSGFVGDTDWTIPSSYTTGDNTYKFNIDCRARQRYLRLDIAPLTTQVITAIANLSKAEDLPIGTTLANVRAIVEG